MKRRRFGDEFKAKVVLEALQGAETVNQIAKRYRIHPLMITKWKKHAVDLLPTLFSKHADQQREEWAQKESELFQEIGQLKYELDWLKKKTATFTQ